MDLKEISDMEFFSTKATEFPKNLPSNYSKEYTMEQGLEIPVNISDQEYCKTQVFLEDSTSSAVKLRDEINNLSFISSEMIIQNTIYSDSTIDFPIVWVETMPEKGGWESKSQTKKKEVGLKSTDETNILIPENDSTSGAPLKDFIKVKFRTMTNVIMVCSFIATSSIKDVKDKFNEVFGIGTDQFWLSFKGKECDETIQLVKFKKKGLKEVEFGIHLKHPETTAAPGEFSRYMPLVTEHTIEVQGKACNKSVKILIENQSFVKSWLGGYRNPATNLEYHHASVQTLPRTRPNGSLPQLSRESQTPVFPLKETLNDTLVSKSTQMCRTDHYISTVTDKILVGNPKRFKIRVRRFRLRTIAFTLISILLLVKARKRTTKENIHKERERECSEIAQIAKKHREDELAAEMKRVMIGCVYPLKRDDFYQLYLSIGLWWKAERAKILSIKESEARKAAFSELLTKQIELLSVIDRKRIVAKEEVMVRQDMYYIETCARPIIFCNNKGKMSSIDTVQIQQAKEYQEIMSSYLNTNVPVEQRIDTLCTLKFLVQDIFYCPEIVDLLEREANLLSIGLKNKELEGLQKRVWQLLLFNLHNPIVNPACKGFKKPSHPRTDDKLYLCRHCNKLKLACEYNVHVKLTSFTMCHSCEWMRNIGQERVNLDPFARILGYVRQNEMQLCCKSSVCYVLQPVGMMYLVRQIWCSESIISRHNDLRNLRMVRFIRKLDWSPWNCILLTLEETVTHSNVQNLKEFYSQPILDRIHWRHLRARQHFMPLLLNDRFMRETNLWVNVQDTGKFLHPSHINSFAQHEDFEFIK